MVSAHSIRRRKPLGLLAFFFAAFGWVIAIALWLTPHLAAPILAQTPPPEAQTPEAQTPAAVALPAASSRVKAPDFPADFKWLNSDQSLALDQQLKGRVVVLDFWTYCCINCMHILPDLAYLEHKYADQPVTIIGVHSAKFENEQDPAQIAQAIRRYRIHHPVIVDQKMKLWSQYNVHAWPTFVIIDSAGRIVGQVGGEGQRQLLDNVIAQLLVEGRANKTLAAVTKKENTAADSHFAPAVAADLSYPGKIITDGKRLFIADSNHDRIVITDLVGQVQQIIGSGKPGFADGPADQSQFLNPQGMALSPDGQTLYVADTDNHAVRKIDLTSRTVATLAGNGEQGNDRTGGKAGKDQLLSSPWDIAFDEPRGRLLIAMAGLHQIWSLDLKTNIARAWLGSGRENIDDGPGRFASLAQTSGLTLAGDTLYFADSETSSIRSVKLATGQVQTLVGTGLFDFGLRDGPLDRALLQHPLGIASSGNFIYIADTYNHALRVIDPRPGKQIITTLIPADITGKSPLNEPAGLCIVGNQIFIADTNHGRIVRYDPTTHELLPMALGFSQP